MSSLQKKFVKQVAIVLGTIIYVVLAAWIVWYYNSIASLLIALSPILLGLFVGGVLVVLEAISTIINNWRIRGILNEDEYDVYKEFAYDTTMWNDKQCAPIYLTWDEIKEHLSNRSSKYSNEDIRDCIIVYDKLIDKMKICPRFVFFS